MLSADGLDATEKLTSKYPDGKCETVNREQIGFDFQNAKPLLRFDLCPTEKVDASRRCVDKKFVTHLHYVKLSVEADKLPVLKTIHPDSGLQGDFQKAKLQIPKGCDRDGAEACEPYYQMIWSQIYECTFMSGAPTRWLGKKIGMDCDRFPQNTTADITYPSREFVAYRGAGYNMGRTLVIPGLNK